MKTYGFLFFQKGFRIKPHREARVKKHCGKDDKKIIIFYPPIFFFFNPRLRGPFGHASNEFCTFSTPLNRGTWIFERCYLLLVLMSVNCRYRHNLLAVGLLRL